MPLQLPYQVGNVCHQALRALYLDPLPSSRSRHSKWGQGRGGGGGSTKCRPVLPGGRTGSIFQEEVLDIGKGGCDLIKKTDKCKPEVMHSTVRHKCIFILYAKPG